MKQAICKTKSFSKPFFAFSICQVPSYLLFHKALLNFTRPATITTLGFNDVSSLKLFIRFHVGFSNFREHKFTHDFQGTLNPFYPYSLEAKDTYPFYMHFPNFF